MATRARSGRHWAQCPRLRDNSERYGDQSALGAIGLNVRGYEATVSAMGPDAARATIGNRCLMDGRVEDIAECSGGEIGDFEYDAGIDLGVVVAEDGCGGGIRGCSNGCSGGCEDDSDIDSLCIEVVAESE
ncbi:Hypothetical predicted protein [Octopus vulgaris]|uniref:Uncharacterized protein n=1 Tax=Octopus vulgaris TaxID=6645 RepID=A0AA36FE38_OCTVU|nr:Hypothetical predicted protein [Octopus vulgaris]